MFDVMVTTIWSNNTQETTGFIIEEISGNPDADFHSISELQEVLTDYVDEGKIIYWLIETL